MFAFTAINNTFNNKKRQFNITPCGRNLHELTHWDKKKTGGLRVCKGFNNFNVLGALR